MHSGIVQAYEEYGDYDFQVGEDVCFIDYSKILNQEDFEKVVTKVVKCDYWNAIRIMVMAKDNGHFSLKSILKWQEADFYDENNNDINQMFSYYYFFKKVFSKVAIENKIKYLQSGRLKPRISEILLECIKADPRYDAFKWEIEDIVSSMKAGRIIENAREKLNDEDSLIKTAEIDYGIYK